MRPAYVLAIVVVADWAVVSGIALSAQHNGWLYYTGGDGTYYWTAAYALAHGWIPTSIISYGLPVIMWPLAAVLGPNLLAGLPTIVVAQVALLTPILLVALYGIGSHFGGRLLGYVAASGWVVAPLLALAYFQGGFREDVRNLVVPNTLGLTLLGDFSSIVGVTVVAWLVIRSLDSGSSNDVVLASLVAGFAIGVKPSNTIFLAAPVVGLAIVRRWRHIVLFLAVIVPAAATLTLWKRTGLGYVPLLSLGDVHLAAGASVPSLPVGASLNDYLPFDWGTFHENLLELREVGWSLLLVEWLPIAGAFALIRKAPAAGALVTTWFFAFVFLKGGAQGLSSVTQTSFFRLVSPAYPAFVLLAASLVLLVPTWGRRRSSPVAVATSLQRPTRWVAAAAAALVVYPLVVIAAAGAAPRDRLVNDVVHNQNVPAVSDLHLQVATVAGGTRLSWRRVSGEGARVAYRVYRGPYGGVGCDHHDQGAQDCLLWMAQVTTVDGTSWTDRRPGRWTYRVAAVADQSGRRGGDLVVVSLPARL